MILIQVLEFDSETRNGHVLKLAGRPRRQLRRQGRVQTSESIQRCSTPDSLASTHTFLAYSVLHLKFHTGGVNL